VGQNGVITDPQHQALAASMRQALAQQAQQRATSTRQHADGHAVTLRALPDYDALFGVEFHTADGNPYEQTDEGAQGS
jgi:hypothetical protein